jgi:hypothetical protein
VSSRVVKGLSLAKIRDSICGMRVARSVIKFSH